jgi:Replication-relaxation
MEREMTKSHQKFDAAFKAKIALEALREEELLAWRGMIPNRTIGGTPRASAATAPRRRASFVSLDHMTSEIALDIEIGSHAVPGVRFRNHIEIASASSTRTQAFPNPLNIAVPLIADAPKWIEPDALFAINDRFFALEADMGTESIEAVIKPKIRA